jgi:branched-chain amino acid transport system substrate-binding protein
MGVEDETTGLHPSLSRYLVCCLILLWAIPGCRLRHEEGSRVRIGAYLALSGSQAFTGVSARNGMELAVEEANRESGRKVHLVVRDDQGEPQRAQDAVLELINKERVVAVIGEMVDSRSLAGAPACQQNRTPMISPASTDPRLTKIGDFIFRACYTDPLQGRLLAAFAARYLKLKTVAVFRDTRNRYSQEMVDQFIPEYERAGGKVTGLQLYGEGDRDFRRQAEAVRLLAPAGVLIAGYYTEAALAAMRLREAGLASVLFGPDGWDAPQMPETAGPAAEGAYYLNHFAPDDPQSAAFSRRYGERYGRKPDVFAALAYDATRLLVRAIRKSEPVTAASVRDNLARIRHLQGATGDIGFVDSRDPVKSGVILQIRSGHSVFVTRIRP